MKSTSFVFHVTHRKIKGRLLEASPSSKKLAVVLPGVSYSVDQPVLKTAIEVLLLKNYQVLGIDSLYGDDKQWLSLSSEAEAYDQACEDAESLFQQIPNIIGLKPEVVIAKSLGTMALKHVLRNNIAVPKQCVWLTPSFHDNWSVLQDSDSLTVIGTADPRFEKAKAYLPLNALVVDGADHGLTIPKDDEGTARTLEQVKFTLEQWILE